MGILNTEAITLMLSYYGYTIVYSGKYESSSEF